MNVKRGVCRAHIAQEALRMARNAASAVRELVPRIGVAIVPPLLGEPWNPHAVGEL
ncbi:MAG: hypothetical protein R2845_15090 [Thermomicrobiales bacterium]